MCVCVYVCACVCVCTYSVGCLEKASSDQAAATVRAEQQLAEADAKLAALAEQVCDHISLVIKRPA